jgi:hypothetical protein
MLASIPIWLKDQARLVDVLTFFLPLEHGRYRRPAPPRQKLDERTHRANR